MASVERLSSATFGDHAGIIWIGQHDPFLLTVGREPALHPLQPPYVTRKCPCIEKLPCTDTARSAVRFVGMTVADPMLPIRIGAYTMLVVAQKERPTGSALRKSPNS